ncbi:hypothetical protein HanRHA438_Chr11g0521821 [Helianthus annuus]|nr:hypothetical protein HanRHA438_Chr11g0521821 [Helianthus annuus]
MQELMKYGRPFGFISWEQIEYKRLGSMCDGPSCNTPKIPPAENPRGVLHIRV